MVTLLAKDFIEVEATDVLEVHRSENPVFLNDGNTEWEAQAFICVIKQKNQPKIHIALRLRNIPASLLYMAEPPTSAPADTEQARQQAHALMQLVGASMQEVNLKHSPAMREVILREIPVLLPPETARRISREKETLLSEYRQLLNDQAARQEVLAAEGELSLAQWTKRKEELDALAGNAAQAAEYLDAEERATAGISALQKALVPFLKKVNAAEIAAEEKLKRERLQKEQATAVQQKAELKERILLLEKELAQWKKEEEVLSQAKAAGDQELSRLQQTLAQAEKSLKAAKAQLKTSEMARAEMENRCATLEKGLRQQEIIEKEGKEKLKATLNELQKTRELLTLSLAERQKLEAEPASKGTSQDTAETSGAGNGSRKRLLQLESDLRSAEERAENLRLEVERLAAEKTLAEKRIASMAATARFAVKKNDRGAGCRNGRPNRAGPAAHLTPAAAGRRPVSSGLGSCGN